MSLDIYLNKPKCTKCGHGGEVYSANITHNLGDMAAEAGIYEILWRAEENDIQTASQLLVPLCIAITDMRKHPEKYRKHDADNGWGIYDDFLPWLERLLKACDENPQAEVSTSR
jgi:hypothetical protein